MDEKLIEAMAKSIRDNYDVDIAGGGVLTNSLHCANAALTALRDNGYAVVPVVAIEAAWREGALAGHTGDWRVRADIDVGWRKSKARKEVQALIAAERDR